MRCTSLTDSEQRLLLAIAVAAIERGLGDTPSPLPARADWPPAVLRPGASFVTLKHLGELRGCIGSLSATRPLADDVAANAYAAAFRDPRFAPLRTAEKSALSLSLALLTDPEPLQFDSETDLLRQLRPGEDGLVLTDRGHRGTFLPAVWESLPQPREFLRQLKRKAGLPADYWSDSLRIERYATEQIGPIAPFVTDRPGSEMAPPASPAGGSGI